MPNCLEVVYEEGGNQAVPSYSRKSPRFRERLENEVGRIYDPGNGWVYYYQLAKLLLVLGDSRETEIDVAPFFRENWGKITKNRVAAIEESMPKKVTLDKNRRLKDETLNEWLLRAKKFDSPAARKERKRKQKEEDEKKEKRIREREASDLGLPKTASWEEIHQAEEVKYQEELRKKQNELEERRKNALKLSFQLGQNPKDGLDEWKTRHRGALYVLRREDDYSPTEGEVPVEKIRDLVSDRILLVKRI
ncbi:MAG: hypothetical protein HYY55_00995 [Candidatus Niyogibacteria bacterium]|nr:MAG: hypothetical protein HYY55_00995 [Candidatus Niyogibacteria bacterium]